MNVGPYIYVRPTGREEWEILEAGSILLSCQDMRTIAL